MSAETLKVVNGILQTLRDGQQGFTSAAEGVKDDTRKKHFLEFAAERGALADGQPSAPGTTTPFLRSASAARITR